MRFSLDLPAKADTLDTAANDESAGFFDRVIG